MKRSFLFKCLLALATLFAPLTSMAEEFIIVQSTTSTQNSGLFDYLLPQFEKDTGIQVRVVAVGTGQAIRNAQNGDGDVLFVHAKAAEQKFVAEGWGVERFDVMYNDFVIVGPAADPAQIGGSSDVVNAMHKIKTTTSTFASRGDDSGTNKAELRLWVQVDDGVAPESGNWYLETGSGMGATLNFATAKGAYTLTDRATWISFGNKGDFKVLVEGDPKLFNQYGITLVNPAKFSTIKAAAGQNFIDWVTGDTGQAIIASYKIDGQQLFFPNAN